MEWDAPAILLDVRPYGEGDAVATVMTGEHGLHRGLARGGASRAQVALWQPGNLVQVRWIARLADQLGSFSAEMIHPGAAHVLDDALALAMLTSVCAVAEGALPEREPHQRIFEGLLRLIAPAARAHNADRPCPLGTRAVGRSWLRTGSECVCRHRRNHGLGFRLAAYGPGSHQRRGWRMARQAAAASRLSAGRRRGRSRGVAGWTVPDGPFSRPRCVRSSPQTPAAGAADAVRPRRRARGGIGVAVTRNGHAG